MSSPEQPQNASENWFDKLEWEQQKRLLRAYRRYYRERHLRVARGLAVGVLSQSEWLTEQTPQVDEQA